MKLIRDDYRKSRGGNSRLLDITCLRNSHHLFYYQKDGPGIIKRLYLDRIYPVAPKSRDLICKRCKEVLGIRATYKRENRPAYRVFVGAIAKRVVSADAIK